MLDLHAQTIRHGRRDANRQHHAFESIRVIRALSIDAGQIQRITITGSPAHFEQKRPGTDQVTRGRAKQMVYEAGPGIVSLVDDAWLSDGNGREMESPGLWYDIRNQEMGYSSDKKRNPAAAARRPRLGPVPVPYRPAELEGPRGGSWLRLAGSGIALPDHRVLHRPLRDDSPGLVSR